jgi:hypothetical protein
VGFVVDEASLEQIFSEYFGILCHSFHRLLHAHHRHLSGTGTTGQIVIDVPSVLSLNPLRETKKKKEKIENKL